MSPVSRFWAGDGLDRGRPRDDVHRAHLHKRRSRLKRRGRQRRTGEEHKSGGVLRAVKFSYSIVVGSCAAECQQGISTVNPGTGQTIYSKEGTGPTTVQ